MCPTISLHLIWFDAGITSYQKLIVSCVRHITEPNTHIIQCMQLLYVYTHDDLTLDL